MYWFAIMLSTTDKTEVLPLEQPQKSACKSCKWYVDLASLHILLSHYFFFSPDMYFF